MFLETLNWIVETILSLGYVGIFMLMCIESSFIPFPSEIVLVPAGYLASQGQMSISIILLMATLGSLVGALINYALAIWLGRAFLLRYGKFVFISSQTLDKLELFFRQHGEISTFSGRLIPGIRQLISIPAGLSRMRLGTFMIYTSLGAAIWSLILILLGYFVGENQALLKEYLTQITVVVLLSLIFLVALYVYRHKKKNL